MNFIVRCDLFFLSIEDVKKESVYLDVYEISIFPCGELIFSFIMIHY
jgi:hypothetical protein